MSLDTATIQLHTNQTRSLLRDRFLSIDPDKLRGGYYTNEQLAKWLCKWGIQSKDDYVLEPSCGDGSFIEAATRQLIELGTEHSSVSKQIRGVEIIADEAKKARQRMRALTGCNATAAVKHNDFFEWWVDSSNEKFDCVIGNPPFIRYQSFPEPSRSKSMEIMVELGMKANRLTNIWVPFVAAASASLKDGGRMALVLPAELLQVTYSAQLRTFLVNQFSRIDIVACNELFFENAQQEVVLLLADGKRSVVVADKSCQVSMTEMKTVEEIVGKSPSAILKQASPKFIDHGSEKWLKFFLTNKEMGLMRALRADGRAVPLSDYASIDVGVVTGKNQFFVLSQDQVDEYGLADHVTPLVGRASQLNGAKITRSEWKRLAKKGDRVFLFNVPKSMNGELSNDGHRYVQLGEEQKYNLGYKCSIRTPWYSVPSVWEPDGFFFRQVYDFPRVIVNSAGATSTDTIHRLRSKLPMKQVASGIYTHLTAASAEIEGRSYGGGVLELEPTEAERMLVPSGLPVGLPVSECDRLIRAGQLSEVLDQNDRLILQDCLGLSRAECAMLKTIWIKMKNRRLHRKKSSRKDGRVSGVAV